MKKYKRLLTVFSDFICTLTTPNTSLRQMRISHTQRLTEKNSDGISFLTPVTNSHKTYTLSGRDTPSETMVRRMSAQSTGTGT